MRTRRHQSPRFRGSIKKVIWWGEQTNKTKQKQKKQTHLLIGNNAKAVLRHRIVRKVDTESLGGNGAMHTCGQFWNSEEVLTNQSLCQILHVSHVYTVRYVNFSYGFIVVLTSSFQQFFRTFAAPKCTFCVVLSGMYENFKCFEKNFFLKLLQPCPLPFLINSKCFCL